MSDINILLDGVISFLVASALGLVLLLCLAIFFLRGFIQMRRKGKPFSRQSMFPHLLGILVSLAGCIIIILLIWLSDRGQRPHALNVWLDKWIWFWGMAIVALWPLSAYLWKKRQGTQSIDGIGET